MKLNTFKTLAAAAVFGLATAPAADAARFTYDGVDYNIKAFNGSFTQHRELLEGQVWYGDADLTRQLIVASDWHLPFELSESRRRGPLFAVEPIFTYLNIEPEIIYLHTLHLTEFLPYEPASAEWQTVELRERYWYAVAAQAAPIPLPAGLPLAIGGLATLVLLRRCRTKS